MVASAGDFEHYQALVRSTTIDPSTLLSTDYFNLFNEVIMMLGMLPDMPDLIEDVESWQFKTYAEHFAGSGLSFAQLAIDAAGFAPPATLALFQQNVEKLRCVIEDAKESLRADLAAGDMAGFEKRARAQSEALQRLVDIGSAIVHGQDGMLDQNAIDSLF